MDKGAYGVHKQLKDELKNYLISQYFAKTPILLEAVRDKLDEKGVLYQEPYIESSPSYKTVSGGINTANIPAWMKTFFTDLANKNLGVYQTPYTHQVKALERAVKGEDIFVATGTGSGKTECFMWPLVAKLANEAKNDGQSWKMSGIRTILLYPMNALVADQISRLRRLIGDPAGEFISIFRKTCGESVRRPQFGMYTGRTPYPGATSNKSQDKNLADNLSEMLPSEQNQLFINQLQREGKIPAKKNLAAFTENLKQGDHITDVEDAELITRFEMQNCTPDILITNYSMLEYMLMRPREKNIWKQTKDWLAADKTHKLLFIIDEAHMYRGASGGEVALLIRRLFHKLGIGRDRVQFILTTASMPNKDASDKKAIDKFFCDLTAAPEGHAFNFLIGEENDLSKETIHIPKEAFEKVTPNDFEESNEKRLEALNKFWSFVKHFDAYEEAADWMYDHLADYYSFNALLNACRGDAVSLSELAGEIFPKKDETQALNDVSILIAISTLAKNKKGNVLFPARMHMLFRGIQGVYACLNPDCPEHHTHQKLTLGKIYLSDQRQFCDACQDAVYELYTDSRCGALFLHGYVLKDDFDNRFNQSSVYLWRNPGWTHADEMYEITFYLPPDDFSLTDKKRLKKLTRCYIDVKSGFIHFEDASFSKKEGYRKLYYSEHVEKNRPDTRTFSICPHCERELYKNRLRSFGTQGNQSFFNLIKAQFLAEPPVEGKPKDKFPNEGRKVLLFSDSRQRAAKLARDMSELSDIAAARQLFGIALDEMQQFEKSNNNIELSINDLYYFVAKAVHEKKAHICYGNDGIDIWNDGRKIADSQKRRRVATNRKRRKRKSTVKFNNICNSDDAPRQWQELLLRLFCSGYNTFYDTAISWIEPTNTSFDEISDYLEGEGIDEDALPDEQIIEIFNAWMMDICDHHLALGHIINDFQRRNVVGDRNNFGLKSDWQFSDTIQECLGWESNDKRLLVLKNAFDILILASKSGEEEKYVNLSKVKTCFDLTHQWYRCDKCSNVSPYELNHRCPICCGSETIHPMNNEEMNALAFWRKPIMDAVKGGPVQVIDTEEHTAQLSYKDQRNELWAKTEKYEMRFRDLINEAEDETPVDIISCTTTMEVGIDIGSLVAVGLRNIPPLRENYQQRAGRAGRRGSSLSTIVTFTGEGPHDTMYFNDPTPMFRGDPRRPWIDVSSNKLIDRHLSMIIIQDFLSKNGESLDHCGTKTFFNTYWPNFKSYLFDYEINADKLKILIPQEKPISQKFKDNLQAKFENLNQKQLEHPELYDDYVYGHKREKSLLDALYEEAIIPTYSFPKNVVSTYIMEKGKIKEQVERGLDIAISEYAPGRAIVVDKQTYQIGGLYYPGTEKNNKMQPARNFLDDRNANYLKHLVSCQNCGWFGIADPDHNVKKCPFCGSKKLSTDQQMIVPWGFAPKNGKSTSEVRLVEEYTAAGEPLYSTLPEKDGMVPLAGSTHIRVASRENQRIITLNKGEQDHVFLICKDCGAAVPGDCSSDLEAIQRPYYARNVRPCQHKNKVNAFLGYDFMTDMLVLEFALDSIKIDTSANSFWLQRAPRSLAEAIRLTASKKLDIEFTELIVGSRIRRNASGCFVDVYMYDNLSSGAGYSVAIKPYLTDILAETRELLLSCTCDTACFNCIKHYRNQHVHGILDRHAALQLLEWGIDGTLVSAISSDKQVEKIKPMADILKQYHINLHNGKVDYNGQTKKIVVYPAMWHQPYQKDTVYVSDMLLKSAKPYALQSIKNQF